MTFKDRRFSTARIQRFRASELNEDEDQTICSIEKFGCSLVQVEPTTFGLGWAYTIGIYDTSGAPEIITVGLHAETAEFLLNEAEERLRAGIDLTQGRHRNMIGKVECEFRPVDPKWVRHLMDWALWYYEEENFPVLQAVYPDRENRFPGEEGFDSGFQQPLMQPNAPMTGVEEDFWAFADPDSSFFDWQFPDPPHAKVYLSETVQKRIEPVTYVFHDAEDGSWQFLGDSMADGGGPVLSCLHHPIDRDRSLEELADLPLEPVINFRGGSVVGKNEPRQGEGRGAWWFHVQGRQRSMGSFLPQPRGTGRIFPISSLLVPPVRSVQFAPRASISAKSCPSLPLLKLITGSRVVRRAR